MESSEIKSRSTVDNVYTLENTPFLLTPILVEFYRNYKSSEKNSLLLSYLIFPIVLYKESNKGLANSTKTRTIRSFRKKAERLYGLSERLEEYRVITNLCMQYAVDKGDLRVNQDLSISIAKDYTDKARLLAKETKAAANLAEMLNKVTVLSAFRQLGIKSL